MKHTAWLLLMVVGSLAGCTANQFTPSTPMHVPEALYQPAFYSVGQGLNISTAANDEARRQARLSQIVAAVRIPPVPAAHHVKAQRRQKALSLYGLGLGAMYTGRYTGARYFLLQSCQLDPYSVKTFIALGQVSARLHHAAAANRYYRSALELDPQNPRLQMLAAAGAHGDERAVLRHLLIARQSPQLKADSPLLPRINILLAAALQANGYYRAAESVYRQTTTELNTPRVTYQFNPQVRRLVRSRGLIEFLVGRNALLAGQPQAAVAALSVARKKGFTNPVIFGQLALAKQFTGHLHAAAHDALRYCVHTHNSNPSIALLTELELNQLSAADIRAAADHYKPGPEACMALTAAGRAAWNAGHLNVARRIFAQLVTQRPLHPDAVQSYMVLAVCTGHRLEAIERVTRQMALAPTPLKIASIVAVAAFGRRSTPSAARQLLAEVQHRRLISASLTPQQQVTQLEWQYAIVDVAALRSGHRVFALAITTQVLHQAPRFWPAVKDQCLALVFAHHFHEANALVRTALAQHLGGPDALVVQAKLFAAADRIAAALTTAVSVANRYPQYRPIWREVDHLAAVQRNYPREIAILQRETELFPRSGGIAFQLVQEQYAFGDLGAFRKAAQTFLTRFPAGSRHLIVAAMVDSVNSNWPGVQQKILIARHPYPASKLVSVWLASLCASMGHATQGVKILRRALRYHPASSLLLAQYADLCYRAGDAGAAYVYARQVAARYPQSARLREAYLDVLLHNHLWLQARQLVAAWQRERPHSFHALQALWRIEFRSHHYTAALAVARKLVHRSIPRLVDLSCLANTYWKLHQKRAALRVYRHLLAIAPQDAYANNNLGFAMVQQNQHLRQAAMHIGLAVHNYPDTAQYLDSYGWVFYKLGFAVRAVPYLERAAVLAGFRHPTVFRHLGDALAKMGDWNGAWLAWHAGVKAIHAHTPLNAHERRLLKRLEHRIKSEKIRESLRHLKNAQAM